MDVDDTVILVLTVWTVICMITVSSVDVFVTLLLIGLLVVVEVGGMFMKPEIREGLKPVMYILMFAFMVIVVKKIMEVLS